MKTIKDFSLNNKKVIIRVDFNVPIKNKEILDDNRLIQSLPTIKYAIENGAKVILLSHLGRIKTEEDLEKNDLSLVVEHLSKLLNQEVKFVNKTRGSEVEEVINNLNSGEIALLQNTRYEDLIDKKESNNDSELGKYWASLGDIFINDAFGTCHRAHASNVGIATYLPSGIGFLVEKELNEFEKVLNNPKHPFVVILGGAKVSDKIKMIENIVPLADYVLIGGGMAYTFLKSQGINIGKSLLDEENISFCQNILTKYSDKIILPIDSVNAKSPDDEARECFINEIKDDEMGLDIGYNTIKLFKTYLEKSKTVIWNGPMGMFENDKFSKGTIGICNILKDLDATKIVGGGDTGSAIINLGYKDAVTHISTGGGASLELLEGKELPGIKVIKDK